MKIRGGEDRKNSQEINDFIKENLNDSFFSIEWENYFYLKIVEIKKIFK